LEIRFPYNVFKSQENNSKIVVATKKPLKGSTIKQYFLQDEDIGNYSNTLLAKGDFFSFDKVFQGETK